jgi:hypothetical protein
VRRRAPWAFTRLDVSPDLLIARFIDRPIYDGPITDRSIY